MAKRIKFDRKLKEYALFLNGQCIGYASTYAEAERRLDEEAYRILTKGA
jgi:hypothetical protein